MFVPRATRTLEGFEHPGRFVDHPRNSEPEAGRASSLTTVPTGKNCEHEPDAPPPRVTVQLIPAGDEVTLPLPPPPGSIEILPLLKWNAEYVVTIPYLWVLKSPPIVPTMMADPVASGDVAIGKFALVEPAGTVTFAGAVAMWGASFERSTTIPPGGAAAVSLTVPVVERPWTTSAGLMVTADSVGAVDGGGEGDGAGGDGEGEGDGELTVQPDSVAVAELLPSLTVTLQSAGRGKLLLSMRKFPEPSERPEA
jgi:hypothetical protein